MVGRRSRGAGPRVVLGGIGGTWFSLWWWLVLSEHQVPENCCYYYRVLKNLGSKASLHLFPQPHHSLVFPWAMLLVHMGLVQYSRRRNGFADVWWVWVSTLTTMRVCEDHPQGWVQQKLPIQLISILCLGGFCPPGMNKDFPILPIPALCISLWENTLLGLLHGWARLGGRSGSTGSVQHQEVFRQKVFTW